MSDSEWNTVAEEMEKAADLLEKVSAIYGYPNTEAAGWSARELRVEAKHVKREGNPA